ncbi:hypothetical protein BCV70DRAFT_201889 [Testicularia cyperi]|uniref:CENP-V/GFA domain-containing protein n=1 Tax=Testicularia cyperi TaxID=1882483 RepID=A0A317XMH1_9BASI|nr:hypothetical protein BCV70DRAFT_201889 [Testicularia cyperi]
MPLEGSCLCGSVQVSVSDSALPLTTAICRCTNCQQTAGSMYSLVSIVEQSQLTITGETKIYNDTTPDSGNTTQRYFCPACGSPIQTVGPSRPGKTVVKCGLFAKSLNKQFPKPAIEIFDKNTNAWESHVDGSKTFETRAQ